MVQSSSTPGHCFNFSRAKASRAQHLHSISSGLGDPTMITVKHDYFDGNHENTQYIAPTPYFSIKIVLLAAYYCYGKIGDIRLSVFNTLSQSRSLGSMQKHANRRFTYTFHVV